MGGLDIFIIAALGYAFYKGYNKGIIDRLAAFIGLFLAYNITGKIFGELHQYFIEKGILESDTSKYITYVLTFVLIIILVKVIAILVVKLFKLMGVNFVNKFLGGLINSVIWAILISILIYFLAELHLLSPKRVEEDGLVGGLYQIGVFCLDNFYKVS